MFILEPVFHHTIWGGNRLVPYYGDKALRLGHLYSLRCFDRTANIILNGEHKGKCLYDIIGAFPLSIAVDDACDNLSIQVHPRGEGCKYESYYFLSTPDCGYIYAGIEGVSSERLAELSSSGEILQHLKRQPVSAGDYVFIMPQTVHALTAGSLVFEIEQGADVTYRLFDYNRLDERGDRRALQVDAAIAHVCSEQAAVTGRYTSGLPIREETYSTRLLSHIEGYQNESGRCQVLTMLSEGAWLSGIELKIGMSVLLMPEERIDGVTMEKCMLSEPHFQAGGSL